MERFIWKVGCALLCLILNYSADAQVVNIESRRMDDKRQGWSAQGEFNYSYIQNQNTISNLGTRSNFMHVKERHKVMFINDFSFIQSSVADFENRGYVHLRYNYQKTEKLTYETFGQVQFSQQMRLYPRCLLGVGPRYKIYLEDSIRVYAGAALMYEYEKLYSPTEVNSNERMNFYVSVNFFKIPSVVIDLLVMYQPRLVDIHDRRIQTELRFDFPISKYLQFRFASSLYNDSRPPASVPQTFTNVRNGILFSF